jgi:hypothetical protein
VTRAFLLFTRICKKAPRHSLKIFALFLVISTTRVFAMEKAGEVVPPELWSHILTFVEDFADVTVLKSVNKLFHVALRPKDPFLILANRLPTISPGKLIEFQVSKKSLFNNRLYRLLAVRKFFKKFDRSYSSISRSELFAM